jgi:hypothetical protein
LSLERMINPARAANIALALLPAGWVLICLALLWSMGDPDPRTSITELNRGRIFVGSCLGLGVLFLIASVWLSGFSFAVAKRRAIAVLVGFVVLPAILSAVIASI